MIDGKLLSEIEKYCKANDIEHIGNFVNKLLLIGFNIERYGNSPLQKFREQQGINTPTVNEKIKDSSIIVSDGDKIEKQSTASTEKPKKRVRIIKNS